MNTKDIRDAASIFWTLVFISLIAIIVYVGALVFAPGSLFPVLGLVGAAGGLALFGTVRLYRRRRYVLSIVGGIITLGAALLAFAACVDIGDVFHVLE